MRKHLFLARNCTKIAEPDREQTEVNEGMTSELISIQRLMEIVHEGNIVDGYAIFLALEKLNLLNSEA